MWNWECRIENATTGIYKLPALQDLMSEAATEDSWNRRMGTEAIEKSGEQLFF
jgi:hypothetical protein